MTELIERGVRDEVLEDESGAPRFKPFTRQEAQELRARLPMLAPWRVVAAQAAAGLLCCAFAWALSSGSGAPWSAFYGGATVVLPNALFARGMSRNPSAHPGAAVFGFVFWELVKIGVAVAMLVAAPRVVQDLSWPALLVALVVCVKVNWLALLWRGRPVVSEPKQRV
jgi:ATP synthase protein I